MPIYELTMSDPKTTRKRDSLKQYMYKADEAMGGSYAMADVVAMSYKETPSRYEGITQVAYENPEKLNMTREEVQRDPGKAVQRVYNRTILDVSSLVFENVLQQTKSVDKANYMSNKAFNHYYNQVQQYADEAKPEIFRNQVASMLRYEEDGKAYTDISGLHGLYNDMLLAGEITEDMIPFENDLKNYKAKTLATKNMDLDWNDQSAAAFKDRDIFNGIINLFTGPDRTIAKARAYQEQYGPSTTSMLTGMATSVLETIGMTAATSAAGNLAKGTKAMKYMKNITSLTPMATNVTQSALMDANNEMYGFNERYFRKIDRNETTNLGKYWLTRAYDAGTYGVGTLAGSWLWESRMFGNSLSKIGGLTGIDKVKALMGKQIAYPLLDGTSDLLIDVATANLIFRPFNLLTDPTAMSMDIVNNPELSAGQNLWQNLTKFSTQWGMRFGGRIAGAFVNSGYRHKFNKEKQYTNLLGTNEWIDNVTKGVQLSAFDKTTLGAMKTFNWLFGNSLDAMDMYYRDKNNAAPLESRLKEIYEGKSMSQEEAKDAMGIFYMSMEASKNLMTDKLWSVLTTGKLTSRYVKELNYGKPGIDDQIISSLNKVMAISPLNVIKSEDVQDIGIEIGNNIFKQISNPSSTVTDKDMIDNEISKLYHGHNFNKEDKLALQFQIGKQITDNISKSDEASRPEIIKRYDNVRQILNSIATSTPSKTQLSSDVMKYTDDLHSKIKTRRGTAEITDTVIGKKSVERGGITYSNDTSAIDDELRTNRDRITDVIKEVKDMLDNGEDIVTKISGSTIFGTVRELIQSGKVDFGIKPTETDDFVKWHARVKRELNDSVGDLIQSRINNISELLRNATENIARGKESGKADMGLEHVSNQLLLRNQDLHNLILIFPDQNTRLNTFITDLEDGNKYSKEAIAIYNSAAKNSPLFKAITKDIKESEENYTAVQALRALVNVSNGFINRKAMINNVMSGMQASDIGFDATMKLLKADNYNLDDQIGRKYISRNPGFAPTELTSAYITNKEGRRYKVGSKFMSGATSRFTIFTELDATQMLKSSSAQEDTLGMLTAALIKFHALKEEGITRQSKGVEGYNNVKKLLKDIFNINVTENDDKTIDIDYRTIDVETAATKIKDSYPNIQKNINSAYMTRESITAEGIDKIVEYSSKIKGTNEDATYVFRSAADIYEAIKVNNDVKQIGLDLKDVVAKIASSIDDSEQANAMVKNAIKIIDYDFYNKQTDDKLNAISQKLINAELLKGSTSIKIQNAIDVLSSKALINNVTSMFDGITLLDIELVDNERFIPSELKLKNMYMIQASGNSQKATIVHLNEDPDTTEGVLSILNNFKQLHNNNMFASTLELGDTGLKTKLNENTLSSKIIKLIDSVSTKSGDSKQIMHDFIKGYVDIYKNDMSFLNGIYKKYTSKNASKIRQIEADYERDINIINDHSLGIKDTYNALRTLLFSKDISKESINNFKKTDTYRKLKDEPKNIIDTFIKNMQSSLSSKAYEVREQSNNLESAYDKITKYYSNRLDAVKEAYKSDMLELTTESKVRTDITEEGNRIDYIEDIDDPNMRAFAMKVEESYEYLNKLSDDVRKSKSDEAIKDAMAFLVGGINVYREGSGGAQKRLPGMVISSLASRTPKVMTDYLKTVKDNDNHEVLTIYASTGLNSLNGATIISKDIKNIYDRVSPTGEGGKSVFNVVDGSHYKQQFMEGSIGTMMIKNILLAHFKGEPIKENADGTITVAGKKYSYMIIDSEENIKNIGYDVLSAMHNANHTGTVKYTSSTDVIDYARVYEDKDLFSKMFLSTYLQEAQQTSARKSMVDIAATLHDGILRHNINMQTLKSIRSYGNRNNLSTLVDKIIDGEEIGMAQYLTSMFSEVYKPIKFDGLFAKNVPLLQPSLKDIRNTLNPVHTILVYDNKGKQWDGLNRAHNINQLNGIIRENREHTFGTDFNNKMGIGSINLAALLQQELDNHGIVNKNIASYQIKDNILQTTKVMIDASMLSKTLNRLNKDSYDNTDVRNAMTFLAHNREASKENVIMSVSINGHEHYMAIPNRSPATFNGAIVPALIVSVERGANGNKYSGIYETLMGGDFDGDQSSYWKIGEYVEAARSYAESEDKVIYDPDKFTTGITSEFVKFLQKQNIKNYSQSSFSRNYKFLDAEKEGIVEWRQMIHTLMDQSSAVGAISNEYKTTDHIITSMIYGKDKMLADINENLPKVFKVTMGMGKTYVEKDIVKLAQDTGKLLDNAINRRQAMVIADEITLDNKPSDKSFYGAFIDYDFDENKKFKKGNRNYFTMMLHSKNNNNIGLVLEQAADGKMGYKIVKAYNYGKFNLSQNDYHIFYKSAKVDAVGKPEVTELENKRIFDEATVTQTINMLGVENQKYGTLTEINKELSMLTKKFRSIYEGIVASRMIELDINKDGNIVSSVFKGEVTTRGMNDTKEIVSEIKSIINKNTIPIEEYETISKIGRSKSLNDAALFKEASDVFEKYKASMINYRKLEDNDQLAKTGTHFLMGLYRIDTISRLSDKLIGQETMRGLGVDNEFISKYIIDKDPLKPRTDNNKLMLIELIEINKTIKELTNTYGWHTENPFDALTYFLADLRSNAQANSYKSDNEFLNDVTGYLLDVHPEYSNRINAKSVEGVMNAFGIKPVYNENIPSIIDKSAASATLAKLIGPTTAGSTKEVINEFVNEYKNAIDGMKLNTEGIELRSTNDNSVITNEQLYKKALANIKQSEKVSVKKGSDIETGKTAEAMSKTYKQDVMFKTAVLEAIVSKLDPNSKNAMAYQLKGMTSDVALSIMSNGKAGTRLNFNDDKIVSDFANTRRLLDMEENNIISMTTTERKSSAIGCVTD